MQPLKELRDQHSVMISRTRHRIQHHTSSFALLPAESSVFIITLLSLAIPIASADIASESRFLQQPTSEESVPTSGPIPSNSLPPTSITAIAVAGTAVLLIGFFAGCAYMGKRRKNPWNKTSAEIPVQNGADSAVGGVGVASENGWAQKSSLKRSKSWDRLPTFEPLTLSFGDGVNGKGSVGLSNLPSLDSPRSFDDQEISPAVGSTTREEEPPLLKVHVNSTGHITKPLFSPTTFNRPLPPLPTTTPASRPATSTNTTTYPSATRFRSHPVPTSLSSANHWPAHQRTESGVQGFTHEEALLIASQFRNRLLEGLPSEVGSSDAGTVSDIDLNRLYGRRSSGSEADLLAWRRRDSDWRGDGGVRGLQRG
ncbi:hypothetical protein HDU67_008161 [Dinochytrium kinnereticum]|nr:hypothetical protein HDU67_008161 [Dinochytrium kinnereticum]